MLTVSRRELKYLMTYENSVKLQTELDQLLKLDSHSKNGYYKVRSLYFDTIYNKDYGEKYDGLEKRKKIRLRIYSTDQKNAKFEIKQKDGNYQRKDSIIISKDDAKEIVQGNYSVLLDYEGDKAKQLYSMLILGAYSPAAIIEYERRAYIYDEFSTRITFDRKVQSSEFFFDIFSDDIPFVPVINENVILEVKYNGVLLESIKNILAKYKLTNVSVSKYGNGRPFYDQL